MLSAKNREVDVVKGLESGCNDFVTKPFGSNELNARIDVQFRLRCVCPRNLGLWWCTLSRECHRCMCMCWLHVSQLGILTVLHMAQQRALEP